MNMNDEMICGYLVTAEQKKCNAVFLDLLREFGRLCENAGFTWWLMFGALIGAVRHKGFIPWDDDVDIALPRADFDKLAAMTNEQFGVKPPYFLQNAKTDPGCVQTLLAFRRSDTTSIRSGDWKSIQRTGEAPYHLGLGLAIFPVDGYPGSKFFQSLQFKAAYWLRGAYYRAYPPDDGKPIRYFICRCVKNVIGDMGFFRLHHWPYRICRKNRSGKVQSFAGFYTEPCIWDAADFAGTVMLPFEDITVPAPVGYDRILTCTYGDYMQFPPPEKRAPKHGGYERADVPYAVSAEKLRSGEAQFPES